MTEKTEEKEESGLGWKMKAGIVASILYAVAAILILGMNLYYSPPSPPMELNEVGDYLAGAFSPLAFLWLVIGYLMQNKELKNQITEFIENSKINSDSLAHQIKVFELENTKYLKKIKPVFVNIVIIHKAEESTSEFKAKNIGECIYDVSISQKGSNVAKKICDEWKTGETIPIKLEVDSNDFSNSNPKEIYPVSEPLHVKEFIIHFTAKDGDYFYLNMITHFGISNYTYPLLYEVVFEKNDSGEMAMFKGIT